MKVEVEVASIAVKMLNIGKVAANKTLFKQVPFYQIFQDDKLELKHGFDEAQYYKVDNVNSSIVLLRERQTIEAINWIFMIYDNKMYKYPVNHRNAGDVYPAGLVGCGGLYEVIPEPPKYNYQEGYNILCDLYESLEQIMVRVPF
jgi:hypothetical protein